MLGELDDNQVILSKMKEIPHCKRNGVFEEGKNTGQKIIDTKWGHLREGQGGMSIM